MTRGPGKPASERAAGRNIYSSAAPGDDHRIPNLVMAFRQQVLKWAYCLRNIRPPYRQNPVLGAPIPMGPPRLSGEASPVSWSRAYQLSIIRAGVVARTGRPLIVVLTARQVLQGALIVCWRNPTRLPAHLFSGGCLLLSSLPLVCVEKVLGVGRTRDAIRGRNKLWCPS